MILAPQRHLFDIPRNICYLNAAYMTPLTKEQHRAGQEALSLSMHPWEVSADDFFPVVEEIRSLAGQILNADADSMAIIPAVSYGMATAAKNLPLAPREAILVLEEQFPSNVYEWQSLADKVGGEIITVATPKDDDWTTAVTEVLEQFGNRISIVALPHVHWSSGAALDLVCISAVCKRIGAALVLDLTQSIGAMPIDMQKVDPDFAIAGGYKWMMGPYSLGVMYVAPRWQQGKPLEQNWIARKASEDFRRLVNYQSDYQPGARRFDMGERSNFILAPIYREGLRQLLEWGIENIAETLMALNARFAALALDAGFRPVNAAYRGPHLLGVHIGTAGDELLMKLKAANVSASVRGDTLRIAPHLWIDEQDEAVFASAIKV
ncbi:aminotransferase class V-fold PLP-dependent enzyme [Kordiimonas sp.]|uniref:aminotransferase class V-fold PLP-dependent enzyme n=1 Tax=Kordiimonas sp. TaxID=1970157 RepID=UPI003A944AB5